MLMTDSTIATENGPGSHTGTTVEPVYIQVYQTVLTPSPWLFCAASLLHIRSAIADHPIFSLFFCCFLHRISSFQHGLSKSHQNVCTVAFGLLCAQLRLALNKAQRYINKCSIYKCAFFLCAPRFSLASNNNSTFYCSYLSLKLISRCCCLVPALSSCPCHVAESGVA